MGVLDESSTRIRKFYQEKKKYQPLVAFVAGFTWDSLTLTRIDLLLDNMILLGYILLTGGLITLLYFPEDRFKKIPVLGAHPDWLENAIQFFFGGLFSAYVVYYFQSATLSGNWLFLLFLLGLFIGNEFVRSQFRNEKFIFSYYFFSVFSFFVFYLPILFHRINAFVFLLSGIISLSLVSGLYTIINRRLIQSAQPAGVYRVLLVIFILFNLFYFLNIIPPVPLSKKHVGIYHSVYKTNGSYQVSFEKGAWYQPFKSSDDTFHYAKGDTVFCFASVFAPTRLNTKIYHEWEYYNDEKGEWKTTDRNVYKITGGRDGGYRGFTYKTNLQPGKWRVSVQTAKGQIIARDRFTLVPATEQPVFKKTER